MRVDSLQTNDRYGTRRRSDHGHGYFYNHSMFEVSERMGGRNLPTTTNDRDMLWILLVRILILLIIVSKSEIFGPDSFLRCHNRKRAHVAAQV